MRTRRYYYPYFSICSKYYVLRILSEKPIGVSKTVLFSFIHINVISHIFQRNLMFSLSNILEEMGVGI